MRLTARWVIPVSSPPIENGTVEIDGDRIVYVGPQRRTPTLDLGDAALLPGLVNAHGHLEFSHLKGKTTPGGSFTQWVREVSSLGAKPPSKDILDRILRTGTTTLADHCSPDTPSFEAPFRRIVFWEILGSQRERSEASLQKAVTRASSEGGNVTPHSFYAVHEETLKKIQTPRASIHFLESEDENAFFHRRSGPLADYVLERGGHVGADLVSALQSLAAGTLLIHGNYSENSEFELLKTKGITLVHCPGSHRFFGHRKFPLEECRRNGIPIALGTDSLASNEDLSMLREMRLFHETYPEMSPEEILKMATLGGARALGMEKDIGSIEVGKRADLIAVRGDLLKAEEVIFSMVNGKGIWGKEILHV